MATDSTLPPVLLRLAGEVGDLLRARGETIAVAESAAGGLVSAALLAVPGASAYYRGGAVVYTREAGAAFLAAAGGRPAGLRGATEDFARYEADGVRATLDSTWGVGETGAAGPAGNPYGDPPGHAWVAVAGPVPLTEHVLTGLAERDVNMVEFASAALGLLQRALRAAPDTA